MFGGGGWVLFGKPPGLKCKEVYNDYNSNLANLFYCVKNRTLAFLKKLGFLPINSRDEFAVLRRFFEEDEFDVRYLSEELELAQVNLPQPEAEKLRAILLERAEPDDVWRAAAFFKLIRYSYGSGCTSFGCQPFDVRKVFFLVWEASRRLKDTLVENKDFEALIGHYDRDDAFFYCDPPYYETEEYSLRELSQQRFRPRFAAHENRATKPFCGEVALLCSRLVDFCEVGSFGGLKRVYSLHNIFPKYDFWHRG